MNINAQNLKSAGLPPRGINRWAINTNNAYTVKKKLYIFLLALLPLAANGQKISLGSCETKDGGQYKGEMVLESHTAREMPYTRTVTHTKANT